MATLSAMLCRLIFLIGCAGSTSVVAYACLFGTVDPAEIQRRFASASGYSLAFDSLSEPRPGCVLLSGVRLVDPETGEVALSALTAEIESNGTDVGVSLSDATFDSPRFGDFRKLSEEALSRFAGDVPGTVWIELGSVSFDAVERDAGIDLPAETLRDVTVRLRRTGATEGSRQCDLRIEFRRSDRPEAERAEISLERHSEGGIVRSLWRIDTKKDGLPCTFLARWMPELATLGPDAEFRGAATLADEGEGLAGEAGGVFQKVDLHSLVTARFPHKLSGRAEVTIHSCRWKAGRLESLAAGIAAGEGTVGRSLVESFRNSLGCRMRPNTGLSEISPYFSFRELKIGFELTDEGRLRLAGLLQPTGTILQGEEGPILSEGKREYVPVSRLVYALAPQSDVQVPATDATRTLIDWLPLPEASFSDANAAPRAVVRLQE
ncbi:MAG TPA: hypothetical protein VGN57_05975 [Pirellulaceae bacterium]|jgi:hypothetical protein|nr:hypothetical protein [Pirellulaceae bacterium]